MVRRAAQKREVIWAGEEMVISQRPVSLFQRIWVGPFVQSGGPLIEGGVKKRLEGRVFIPKKNAGGNTGGFWDTIMKQIERN